MTKHAQPKTQGKMIAGIKIIPNKDYLKNYIGQIVQKPIYGGTPLEKLEKEISMISELFDIYYQAQQNDLLQRVIELIGEDEKPDEQFGQGDRDWIEGRNTLRHDLKAKISQMGEGL